MEEKVPTWLQCVNSPCPEGCLGLEVTDSGPIKYRLTNGSCRFPESKECALKVNREKTNDERSSA